MTDQFTVSAPGAAGPPIICGTNGGYHSKFLLELETQIHNTNKCKLYQIFSINRFSENVHFYGNFCIKMTRFKGFILIF